MSFLDRFKRKASEDKAPENAPEVKRETFPATKAEVPLIKPDPAVQMAVAAAAAVASSPNFDLKPETKQDAPATPASIPAASFAGFGKPQHEIVLELGDFLERIPAHLLGDQKPDPTARLSFEVGDVAERIAGGKTTIPVSEIYQRVPDIFRGQILPADNAEIRFPWQKVMKMLVAQRTQQGDAESTGFTAAAADSLAEKLRSRRALRNVIPGSPGDTQAAPTPPPPPPVAPIPIPKPPEIQVPTANAEEDQKMTKDDALRARDVMRGLIARMKGEFERQLAAADQQRKALVEERERVIVELVRWKKESDDKNEQVEFERSVASKSVDNLAKVQQERDAFKIELSNLKVELSKSGLQSDQRIKDLIGERDALAQQQTNLSKQVAEFQKHGKIGAALTEAVAATTPSGMVAAAAQRQVEELQRRIAVLETAQRDNAQELVREREAKLKAERQLAAADRVQESAMKLQDFQGSRDQDSAERKRDSEAARSLKDLQEQSSTLQAANLRLTAELEETRKKLTAAQEASAATIQPEQWEARIAAQFESDIESYRTRIKGLLQEKEALTKEKQSLATQLEEQTKSRADHGDQEQRFAKFEAEHKEAKDTAALLRSENEKLQEQLKSLQTEREDLQARIHSQETQTAGTTKNTNRAKKLAAENETLSQEIAQLRTENERLAKELAAANAMRNQH